MGWKLNSRHDKLVSEINITPLTDVMLVLLVIFMVTTPLIMTESFKVKLPKAVSSTSETGKGVIIAVNEAGEINLNGKLLAADGLSEALRAEFQRGSEKTVVIKADGRARHSVIVKVLDTAKTAGADKLSIATEGNK